MPGYEERAHDPIITVGWDGFNAPTCRAQEPADWRRSEPCIDCGRDSQGNRCPRCESVRREELKSFEGTGF